MEPQQEKCVLVLDEALPMGLAANTAAILGIALGRAAPQLVGQDVADAAGTAHRGIIRFPVPVLRAPTGRIRQLRALLAKPEYAGLTAVDFSDLAQSCKTYDEFIRRMAQTEEGGLQYLGLAICGAKKQVNRLTGSLPLLR